LKVPYVIHADFESLLVPIKGCENDPEKSQTARTTKHIACGFAGKVVGLTKGTSKQPIVYRGQYTVVKFVECMVQEQEDIEQKFKHCETMLMTGSDWQSFKKAKHSHICKKELGEERVRDHCHVTGKFRGAAQYECNINYKYTCRIPVIIHNARGYDTHLIMQAIGKIQGKQLKCISNNMEKHISFLLGCMDFIDSFQFMSSSLEKLVENLAKEGVSKFEQMTDYFGDEKIKLLWRKQVYPYEYFDSESKFTEKWPPPIESFYSSLAWECITEED
jgi:K+/H+ antiporter YhaU regulatory subunit KhtT